jgi:uncharacterized protein involved in cysteine biosynthesis
MDASPPPSLFAPAWRAVAQLDDPALLGVVARSVAWTVAVLVAVGAGLAWGATVAAGWWPVQDASLAGWIAWVAGAAGLAGGVALALFLFVPVATAVSVLFVDRVAEAVERRHYPGMAPGQPASLAAQAWDGLALGLLVLAMQVVALLVTLMTAGLGFLLGWLVAAWAIGRGLFMAVALRRCDRATALALYRQRRMAVLVQGGLVAAAGLVPGVNLVAPVVGLAAMVHVLGRSAPVGPRIEPAGGLSRLPRA